MSSESNKRIAKNTAMLYIRMLITMIVSLYTSRVILNTLGVEDYGIYNVVGGFVAMFSFLSNSMSAATQRFLSFEIGKGTDNNLIEVFSMSLTIHFLIALIIILIAETLGFWFFTTQLTIPIERLSAARWVYQFSILAFIVNVISVPYNAFIIAHERMSIFAWISIVDVILKLAIVYMLQLFGFDKLKLYSVLMFGVMVITRSIYYIYCNKNFQESKYRFFWNKKLFKTLLSYAGWNLWGGLASVLYGQGVNILLNIFFGPIVNAARGIAYQLRGALNNFVLNFQVAVNPQIIKSFASSDTKYMHQLIFQSAKFSFLLLYFLTLPILLETSLILKLWLKIVPEYTILFTQLVIINILIDSISGSLMTAAHASGKIKLYQGVVGGLLLLNLPISYIFLKLGYPPQVTLYISISLAIIAVFARLRIISPLVKLSTLEYFKSVVLKIIPVIGFSLLLPLLIRNNIELGFKRMLYVVASSTISILFFSYIIGLNKSERFLINKIFKRYILHINN